MQKYNTQAIYKLNANSGIVTLTDRYDYDVADYSGIEGAAVNTMFLTQLEGVIVPFFFCCI